MWSRSAPPTDVFERPRTRFVAEFIGRTNVVDGVADAPGVVVRGALSLRVAGGTFSRGAPVAVSIRPHAIAVVAEGEAPPRAENILRGTVMRASYLGEARDYDVRLDAGDLVLRVSAPPAQRLDVGAAVRLAVPAEACVPLAGPDA